MHNIEINIPIPTATKAKYPIRALKVGESFFVPFREGMKPEKLRKRIFTRAYQIYKGTNKKLSSRIVEGGIRFWRIA